MARRLWTFFVVLIAITPIVGYLIATGRSIWRKRRKRPPEAGDGNVKILIVEDDLPVRKMLDAHIKAAAGKEPVLIGGTGSLAGALEWLQEQAPDVVLCDGEFPFGDFTERTLQSLRETDHWVVIWALTVSARKKFALLTGDSAVAARAQAMGIPAFLKPEGVSAVIQYVLGTGK